MIYRYAEIKDLDEIMGLYKEASLNEWCTWDDSYPDTGICKKDIETESLLCLEDNGTIIAAISFDSDDVVDNLELWNKKKGNKEMESFLEAWDLICDYCKKQVTDVSYDT